MADNSPKHFRKARITTKFIFWFLFISLIPLAIAIFISYTSSRQVLKEEVANRLRAVVNNKANQIEESFRDIKNNLAQLSLMPEVTKALRAFDNAVRSEGIESRQYVLIENEFRPLLEYYRRSFDYDNVLLVSNEGRIVFSVKKNIGARSLYEHAARKGDKFSKLAEIFIQVNKTRQLESTDFISAEGTEGASRFFLAPVLSAGDLLGVIVARIDNRIFDKFAGDFTGLGRTGETLIVTKHRNNIIRLAPLRFDSKIRPGTVIPYYGQAKEFLYLHKAFSEKSGTGEFMDYRNKEVLTLWKHLPLSKVKLIIKMDTSEVVASADFLRNVLLAIGGILLVMVMIMAVVIARSIASPIRELTKIADIITKGNFSKRVAVKTKDEIGTLALSFNQMTDHLVEAKENVEKERAKLQDQKKLLEKVNRELDSFVYTVSHDLRAPLRGISSFASFLNEDYNDKLDDDGKSYLKEISRGANRMGRLIEDLLALSRISRVQNPYELTNITALVDSVLERIKYDIQKNKVKMKISPHFPSVFCDRIKLGEVFLNLINNAIKFSSKNNNANPEVEVGYIDAGESHQFFVKDNGIGIEEKYHKDIFGIFKRLHSQGEYEGTGAGLSIVKKIVEDHQGEIWIESQAGKGATFHFTIPKAAKKRKRIGEILIEDGLITKEKLEEELKKQEEK